LSFLQPLLPLWESRTWSPGFYRSILGAALVGIGVALLIEYSRGSSGLGLAGAISINLIAGIVLAGWLIFGALDLPARGAVLLWILVIILLGISGLGLVAHTRGNSDRAMTTVKPAGSGVHKAFNSERVSQIPIAKPGNFSSMSNHVLRYVQRRRVTDWKRLVITHDTPAFIYGINDERVFVNRLRDGGTSGLSLRSLTGLPNW